MEEFVSLFPKGRLAVTFSLFRVDGLQAERWTEPADGHDTTGEYDPRFHNKNGMTYVSVSGTPQAVDAKVLEASKQLGGDYAYNLDFNSGDSLGIGTSKFII